MFSTPLCIAAHVHDVVGNGRITVLAGLGIGHGKVSSHECDRLIERKSKLEYQNRRP